MIVITSIQEYTSKISKYYEQSFKEVSGEVKQTKQSLKSGLRFLPGKQNKTKQDSSQSAFVK